MSTESSREEQTRRPATLQTTRSLSVITTIAIFAATSEQILMAANKPAVFNSLSPLTVPLLLKPRVVVVLGVHRIGDHQLS